MNQGQHRGGEGVRGERTGLIAFCDQLALAVLHSIRKPDGCPAVEGLDIDSVVRNPGVAAVLG